MPTNMADLSWQTGSIFSCCKGLWDCRVLKPITTKHQSVFWLVSQSRRKSAICVGSCRWISLAAACADPVVLQANNLAISPTSWCCVICTSCSVINMAFSNENAILNEVSKPAVDFHRWQTTSFELLYQLTVWINRCQEMPDRCLCPSIALLIE